MQKALPLSTDVHEWINRNLDAGCTHLQITEAMHGQGIDADYATAAVAACTATRRTFGDGPLLQAPDFSVPVLARIGTPRIAVLGPVMRDDECTALIELARPRLKPSTVIDPDSGQDVIATYRGSSGVFLRLRENPLVATLDARLSALLNQPVEHGEGLQVLHYPAGAESAPHFDFLPAINAASRASIARSGQRLATLIVYLNTVAAGGETVFPKLGLAVTPRIGHGLCFEYADAAGGFAEASLHAGAAVHSGEKWIVTKWMRSQPFVPRGA